MDALETLRQWVQESHRIVFFGGAGVSTESGIPDFRSVDGLYHQKFEYPPETIISHSFYRANPAYFFRFYREKMLPLGFQPNVTHQKLAQWEQEGKLLAVVTQNIDGLHQKAGSRRVYELHGSVLRNYCEKCGKFYPAEYVKHAQGVPLCTCGGTVKPDVVLYEESLDEKTLTGSICAIGQADLLMVGSDIGKSDFLSLWYKHQIIYRRRKDIKRLFHPLRNLLHDIRIKHDCRAKMKLGVCQVIQPAGKTSCFR